MNKNLTVATAAIFLVACDTGNELIADETTKSGYVSYPNQYAPPANNCSRNGENGPVTLAAIEQSLREGYPDDAKILATVMNGDAPEPMLEFARECMGYTG